MSKRRQSTNNVWTTVIKILLFILALYLAYVILRPLLSILLGIGFWVVKVMVFLTAALIVIHLFLKMIFQVDLFQIIFGRGWRR